MFNDDVSAIDNTYCNVLSSPNSISSYHNNIRKDFVFVGGTWYLYRTQTASYGNYDTSNYNCIDISTLNSYAVYQPIIYAIAFMLFVFFIVLFYKVIKGVLYVK